MEASVCLKPAFCFQVYRVHVGPSSSRIYVYTQSESEHRRLMSTSIFSRGALLYDVCCQPVMVPVNLKKLQRCLQMTPHFTGLQVPTKRDFRQVRHSRRVPHTPELEIAR